MNTHELISLMWNVRHQRPLDFRISNIRAHAKHFAVSYHRSSPVTIIFEPNEPKLGWITYSDQNPLGKSKEAELVRNGKLNPIDIGWLYISCLDCHDRIWLGKVNKGIVEVIIDCDYNKDKKTIKLLDKEFK
jgi:hypothetical protein